jgi:hypothetical protein
MNFGYLIVIAENEQHDYTKMAYALALSIKNTQKLGYDKVALVTDNIAKIKKLNSSWVFDHVIEWNQETFWDGRSWMDQLSPFDQTVCLDADMLFTRDYSHWIDYFIDNCDLYVANKSYTYRGELVTSDYYRKTFTENKLPNLYSFYTFFKKESFLCKEFFTLGRLITKNPTEFSNMFLQEHKPKVVGTDEAFALSAQILGIEYEISYPLDFPKVLHMKPMVQSWPWPSDMWSDHVGIYIDRKGKIKIASYLQNDIIHYVEKDKITDEIISLLEGILWKKI